MAPASQESKAHPATKSARSPPSKSPSSLLWAHQLKSEHNFLLKRMSTLESNQQQHQQQLDPRVASLEANAATLNADAQRERDALADRIDVLEREGLASRMADAESGLQAVKAEGEATRAEVQRVRGEMGGELKAIRERAAEVEVGLRAYEEVLERLGRRGDDGHIALIRRELATLEANVEAGQMSIAVVDQKMREMEMVVAELGRAKLRLEAAGAEAAAAAPAKPPPKKRGRKPKSETMAAAKAADDAASKTTATPKEGQLPKSKKRTISALGSADDNPQPAKRGRKPKAATVDTHPTPTEKRKPGRPSSTTIPTKPPQVSSAPSKKAQDPPSAPDAMDPSTPKRRHSRKGYPADSMSDPVIRSGKGWYEVAATQGNQEESSEPQSRPEKRAARRKHDEMVERDLATLQTQGGTRSTRGGTKLHGPDDQQEEPPKKRGRKRKSDDDEPEEAAAVDEIAEAPAPESAKQQPKKSGRKPKVARYEPEPAPSVPEAQTQEPDTAKPPPKKRGRKPKSETTHPTPLPRAEATKAQPSTNPEHAPKKRGRKPKVPRNDEPEPDALARAQDDNARAQREFAEAVRQKGLAAGIDPAEMGVSDALLKGIVTAAESGSGAGVKASPKKRRRIVQSDEDE